jgi:hypothetical protein
MGGQVTLEFTSRDQWESAIKQHYPDIWVREQDDRMGHKFHAFHNFKLVGVFATAHHESANLTAAGQGYLETP